MKKLLVLLCFSLLSISFVFADDDDDLFFDDDDGILEFEAETDARTDELNHGALFETGSIKIGGRFDTSVSTTTTLWANDGETFSTHLNDTKLSPALSAYLSLDARPTQTLRMYTKFGLAYPFVSTVGITGFNSFSIVDYLKVKEMFTDFSVNDRAFFRFGLHTVTWGTGYFFSPVSDMINTSSINPEDTDAQVDGAFNLRTQITFPGTQNCLWLYVIPSTDFTQGTAESYLRDTAFAGKGDLVFGNWEIGLGGFYKHAVAPKAMITASGSIGKVSVFGELVYQYGGNSEWKEKDNWANKTSIFQATVGMTYLWKDPAIVLAAQYYFDGNNVDRLVYLHGSDVSAIPSEYKDQVLIDIPRFTEGHNFAVLATFGKVFGSSDFNATVLGIMNVGREENYINEPAIKSIPQLRDYDFDLSQYSKITSIILSGMLNYSPMDSLRFGVGPYITWEDFNSKPVVAVKLSATLGGGKF